MACDGTDPGDFRTGLARSLLQEISQHLAVLAATGEAAAIDLMSLPMMRQPGDRRGGVAAWRRSSVFCRYMW